MAIREAGKYGFEAEIPLSKSINTSTPNNFIFPLADGGPHISNNGTCRDGGITTLYENSYTVTPNHVYACKNGKLVGLDDSGNIYVGDTSSMQLVGSTTPITFSRKALVGYIDAIPTFAPTSGSIPTILGLRFSSSGGLIVDEILTTTWAVLNSAIVTATQYTGARFLRTNKALFSYFNSTSDTGIIAWDSSGNLKLLINSSSYTIATTFNIANTAWGYSLGGYSSGTAVVAVGTGIVYSTSSNWNTWTALTYSSTAGLMIGSIQSMNGVTTTLKLGVATGAAAGVTGAKINFIINVASAGAAPTSSTGFGVLYAGGAEGTFTPQRPQIYTNNKTGSGCVSCLGSAGIYGVSGTGTPGTYGFGYSGSAWVAANKANTATGVVPYQLPDLVAYCGTLNNGAVITARSFLGVIGILAAGANATTPPNMIHDYGGGAAVGQDIPSGASLGALSNAGMFIPPTVTSDSNVISYLTTQNTPIIVVFTASGSPSYAFAEIKPGVVALNVATALNSIIDTTSNILYDNCSAYCNAFHMNLAVNTNVANFKSYNIYSSQLDAGLMYTDAAATNIQFFDKSVQNQKSGIACYGSINGSGTSYTGYYLGDVSSSLFLYYNSFHAGSYVYNTFIPPAADAVFQNFVGINMLLGSAIQGQNYFGYVLSISTSSSSSGTGLLPQKYQAIWILHGSTYAFDGDNIYYLMLSNGTVGYLAAAPVKVAVATGLSFLCASTSKSYFYSPYDNGLYSFDGARTIQRMAQFNREDMISYGVYSMRDSALYLITSAGGTGNVLTIRDEESAESMLDTAATGPIVTSSPYPGVSPLYPSGTLYPGGALYPQTIWSSTEFSVYSTTSGVYFIRGNIIFERSYYSLSNSIPEILKWQSAYLGPGDGQTMSVSRVLFYVYYPNGSCNTQINYNSILLDGTISNYSTSIVPTLNDNGYAWVEINPALNAQVLASSVGLIMSNQGGGAKATILKCLMYYTINSEALPINSNIVKS